MIFSKHLVNYGCEISQFRLNLCPWCNYQLSFGLSCYLHSSFYSQEKKNSVLWTRCNDNNNIILTFLSLFMNCIAQNRGNAERSITISIYLEYMHFLTSHRNNFVETYILYFSVLCELLGYFIKLIIQAGLWINSIRALNVTNHKVV